MFFLMGFKKDTFLRGFQLEVFWVVSPVTLQFIHNMAQTVAKIIIK